MQTEALRPSSSGRGLRSHFQYKNWVWGKAGHRQGAQSVRPIQPHCADLINTCYFNPSAGTKTVHCIVWDLDAHRADPKWRTKKGVLKWNVIRRVLTREHPELMKYLFAAVRSTSGQGIALALVISPMELVPNTEKCQAAARAVQHKILQLLNRYGMGADPGALGLERDFPNWHDPKRILFLNRPLFLAVQSASGRNPVLSELLSYLGTLPCLAYQKKKGRVDLLYPDVRVESKLARLYEYALDHWYNGGNSASGQLSLNEIRQITKLSSPFLRKFLRASSRWLNAEWLGKNEGWGLRVKLDPQMSLRCAEVAEGSPLPYSGSRASKNHLRPPEEVEDGERNSWLTQAALLLKHEGIGEERTAELLAYHLKAIPSYQASRNCRAFQQIVRSIFRNKRHLFGIKPGGAPEWLISGNRGSTTEIASYKAFKEKETKFKKGALPPGSVLRKISVDGCFSFKGNYYSVPQEYLGRNVLVFPWKARLRIADAKSLRFVASHYISEGVGSHVVMEAHKIALGRSATRYLEHLLGNLRAQQKEKLYWEARSLWDKIGVYAVRKIWQWQRK